MVRTEGIWPPTDRGCGTGRGCHGGPGRNRGHGPGGRPSSEESSRACYASGSESVDEASDEDDRGLARCGQIARKRRRGTSPLERGNKLASPSGRGAWCLPYLDLQDVIATDSLVVHIMIRIVSIATIFVLNKCEASSRLASGPRSNRSTS